MARGVGFVALAPKGDCVVKTIRRLIYGEVLYAVAFVTLGFLSLFFFFDLVAEIQAVGRYTATGYSLAHALAYVALIIPSHLYELMPIAVLIGTIFVMARLAQSSEFTILRTSGLDPWRALKSLLILGGGFVLLTFALGDYVSPVADRAGQLLKARYTGRITVGQTGAWLKEKQNYGQYAVNVGELASDGVLHDIRIFEFDNRGFLMSMMQAQSASVSSDEAWQLQQVNRTEFPVDGAETARIDRLQWDSLRWPNHISAEMVSAALSCLVMVVLALPFAYLHFRSGSITTYVFGGVMAGISFFLLNNVFGYIGNLQSWQPWLTAAMPGMIYSVLSLSAFGWLVLRR